MTYTVLSVKQPWAYCIMHLGKDIENRSRKTNIRGNIAIHASKKIDWDAYYALRFQGYALPLAENLITGKILGTIEIVDCVKEHTSAWKDKESWGYVLSKPQPFVHPISAKGNLGFWKYTLNKELP